MLSPDKGSVRFGWFEKTGSTISILVEYGAENHATVH